MRELRLANVPVLPSMSADGAPRWPLSRTALVISLLAHVVGAFVASRWSWTGEPPALPAPTAEFWFVPMPLPPEPLPEPERATPPPVPVEPAPVVEAPPVPRASIVRGVAPEPRTAVQPERPAPAAPPEAESVVPDVAPPVSPPARRITVQELEEARQRAASTVVEEGALEDEFLTFSVDDVAPPRPPPPEEKRSIFDGTGSSGPSVMAPGQQRTRFGRRVAEICNALTGGFSFMGLGSFCAEADDEPSGLFPEVRPEILDLMPECVETRPLAAQLGEESEFQTVKCALVPKKELPERWELP